MNGARQPVAFWYVSRGRVINRAMSWLPDSGWLRALDLKASTAAAVSLGCWAVLGLAELGLLYLRVLPTWVRAGFTIVALLASFLWLGRLWDVGFARVTGWRRRRATLAQLHKISTSEAKLLDGQVAKNEQTFKAAIDHPAAVGLRRKGLLEMHQGIGDILGFPHTIPDFVWSELRSRKVVKQPGTRPEVRSAARRPSRAQPG